jgi:hypothetical protein
VVSSRSGLQQGEQRVSSIGKLVESVGPIFGNQSILPKKIDKNHLQKMDLMRSHFLFTPYFTNNIVTAHTTNGSSWGTTILSSLNLVTFSFKLVPS